MSWDARNSWMVDMVQPVNRLCSLNRGLVSWWLGIPGITGGSRFIDICNPGPNGNHGTLTNMDPATDWVAGPRGGRALDFDGTNDHVVISDNDGLDGNNGLSLLIWAKGATTSDYPVILCKKSTSYQQLSGWLFYVNPAIGGIIDFLSSGGSGNYYHRQSYATSNFTQLHQYAVTWNAASRTSRIYVDGKILGSPFVHSFDVVANTDEVWIARRDNAAGDYGECSNSDVRIYNRALTASEVQAVYFDSLQGYPRTLRRMGRQVFPAAVAGTPSTIELPTIALVI